MKEFLTDWQEFFQAYGRFFYTRSRQFFAWIEKGKKLFSSLLYRQRGRFAQPISHLWLGFLLLLGIFLSPTIEEKLRGEAMGWEEVASSSMSVLGGAEYFSASTFLGGARGEVVEYVVKEGDTVSSIAKKFDISLDTIIWANNLESVKVKIKIGQRLKIPPISGIVHRVGRGETVYSIAKKYQANPQSIVDFPFNTFSNDETFALAINQALTIPEGIMPKAKPATPRLPAATVAVGTAAKGSFIWPTSGKISQRYSWYHPAIDVANKNGPAVVAADGGKVISVIYARYAYGHHVVIDHGNGYRTLYAHMSTISVKEGQVVGQGQSIGRMGSTGRSTGTHLHFEIIKSGVKINPLTTLK